MPSGRNFTGPMTVVMSVAAIASRILSRSAPALAIADAAIWTHAYAGTLAIPGPCRTPGSSSGSSPILRFARQSGCRKVNQSACGHGRGSGYSAHLCEREVPALGDELIFDDAPLLTFEEAARR